MVCPEAASKQIEGEVIPAGQTSSGTTPTTATGQMQPGGAPTGTAPAQPPLVLQETGPTRFHGSVELDAARLGRDAGTIAEEIVQHLAGLVGAKVNVTLEITAEIPDGAPDNVVRTVTENCRTLKFGSHGFEDS